MQLSRPSGDPSHSAVSRVAGKRGGSDDDRKVEASLKAPKGEQEGNNDTSESDSDGNMDEEEDEGKAEGYASAGGNPSSQVPEMDEATKRRREKRLAMNRASAKARRKRKKVLLDSLATQVTELTKRNQTLQLTNDTLRARVDQLESALSQAQATIAALVSSDSRQSTALGQQLVTRPDLSAVAAANTMQQDNHLRSLLQGASHGASTTSNFLGVGALGVTQQEILNAHLRAQGHGRNQLLEAAALGNLRIPRESFGAVASPISSYLGQARLQQLAPIADQSLSGSQSGESGTTTRNISGSAKPPRTDPGAGGNNPPHNF